MCSATCKQTHVPKHEHGRATTSWHSSLLPQCIWADMCMNVASYQPIDTAGSCSCRLCGAQIQARLRLSVQHAASTSVLHRLEGWGPLHWPGGSPCSQRRRCCEPCAEVSVCQDGPFGKREASPSSTATSRRQVKQAGQTAGHRSDGLRDGQHGAAVGKGFRPLLHP